MSSETASARKDFWWRIEVLAWAPLFVSLILYVILHLHYGSESFFMTYGSWIFHLTFMLALVFKAIKCYHLGLKRSYVYWGIVGSYLPMR